MNDRYSLFRNKGQCGVTLLEVLIALVMTTVTLWAISTIYLMQVRTQAVQEDVMEMQQSARATMDLIVRELKMAGYDPRGVNHDTNPLNDFWGGVLPSSSASYSIRFEWERHADGEQ